MHATVCLLHAGQPRRTGIAAKSGQFIGHFSWVTSDPMGVKGLNSTDDVMMGQEQMEFDAYFTLASRIRKVNLIYHTFALMI